MTKARVFTWCRDIGLILLIVIGVIAFQQKDMLPDDAGYQPQNRILVSLNGEPAPIYTHQPDLTLVYFFAPWCKVCELSIDSIEGLADQQVRVVTVALDYDSVEQVQHFVRQQQVTAPVLLGNEQIRAEWKVPGYPSCYLLNKQGEVVSRSFGYNSRLGLQVRFWLNQSNAATEPERES